MPSRKKRLEGITINDSEIRELQRQLQYLEEENEQLRSELAARDADVDACHREIQRLRAVIRELENAGK